MRGKREVCEITGTYVGYIDFAGERYWDYREKDLMNFPCIPGETCPPSDSRNRLDSQYLVTRTIEEA